VSATMINPAVAKESYFVNLCVAMNSCVAADYPRPCSLGPNTTTNGWSRCEHGRASP
jgi:hypothetical protein